ncbi:MAG: transposase [Chthoniobacteraceae bacterium]
MRSRYRVNEPHNAHFITSTIVQWLPVFTSATYCDILVESMEYCRLHKGLRVYGWVIMENHFHAVVFAPDLTRTIADLKKYTARRVLEQLKEDGREWLLKELAYFRAAHKTASEHQIWQEGFHPQAIMDDATMLQKLDYMHNNPVARGMVASGEHWRYSSAHEWLPGALPVLKCDAWR